MMIQPGVKCFVTTGMHSKITLTARAISTTAKIGLDFFALGTMIEINIAKIMKFTTELISFGKIYVVNEPKRLPMKNDM